MKEAHGERSLILRFERREGFLEELPEVRAQFDGSRRLAATGGTRFEHHTVCNFARPAKPLLVRETVVSSEAANGESFLLNEGQCWVCANRVAKFLEFAVSTILAKRRIKSIGIKEDVNVFRESADQVPAF